METRCTTTKQERSAFLALLRACAKSKDLCRGTRIHEDILQRGLLEKCSDALVIMYAKCGALAIAQELLEGRKSRAVSAWTALILAYVEKGQGHDALNCFERMQHQGILPDSVTFACIMKACGSTRAADKGQQVHAEIARHGLLGTSIVVGNSIVDMYVKCGDLTKARRVLEELPIRDVVTWSTLIAGYAQDCQGEQALHSFGSMQQEGLSPNAVTFLCILKACGGIGAVDKGEQIHDEIAKRGLLATDVELGNALVDMYAKCGVLSKAKQVLENLPIRDAVSWNALIGGYSQQGQGEEALHCYGQMNREGICPDAVTFSFILRAISSVRALDKGAEILDEITRQGLIGTNTVLGTAVVDMYIKCGALAKAEKVLEGLCVRDVVSWNAIIAGYAEEGQGDQALSCFEKMQHDGLSPDLVTFASILKACLCIGSVDKGQQIHEEIARQGLLRSNVLLGNALVDMYAKCGAVMKAERVLHALPVRTVVSWNTVIAGYTQEAQSKEALKCFQEMQRDGLSPDQVTFLSVLNACSHLGLVDNAQDIFVSMSQRFSLEPDLEHYTCLIDLFGRTGHLQKAVRVIGKVAIFNYPCEFVNAVWLAILGACRKWGDVNVGRWAFENAVQVDGSNSAVYSLMADIYGAAGIEEDATIVEAMRPRTKHGRTH